MGLVNIPKRVDYTVLDYISTFLLENKTCPSPHFLVISHILTLHNMLCFSSFIKVMNKDEITTKTSLHFTIVGLSKYAGDLCEEILRNPTL